MAKRKPRLSSAGDWQRDDDEPGVERKMRFQTLVARALAKRFRAQARRAEQILRRVRALTPAKAGPPWFDELDAIFEADDYADLMRLFGGAAVDGVVLFGEGIGMSFDAALVNVEAATWARKYVGELIKGVDKTTREAVRKAVEYFVNTPGATLKDAMGLMPFDARRARRVATTEITRAYAEGNAFGAEALAEQYPGLQVTKKWWTNRDDRVCPICAPLHGAAVPIEEPFPADGDDGPVMQPPAHVNCRCWTSYSTEVAG